VVTIFAANRGEGAAGPIDAGSPEDALITRPDADVIVRHLPEGGAVFLTSLLAGRTLGEAAAWALEVAPSFDIAANLAGLFQAGTFTSVCSGES
jgi:hypothetical protein